MRIFKNFDSLIQQLIADTSTYNNEYSIYVYRLTIFALHRVTAVCELRTQKVRKAAKARKCSGIQQKTKTKKQKERERKKKA